MIDGMLPTWCLSIHASWRCQHSGACCKAGWAIPVEGPQFERLTATFGVERESRPLFRTGGPLPERAAAMLATRADGSCVFLEQDGRVLCAVHRELGPQLLPVACRQFPRVVLQDGRGTLVTLSHFCPTAAALLLDATNVEIVVAPPNLTGGVVEGLDATEVLPPLLRPGVLTDVDGYAAWERCGIATLSRGELTATTAVETIAAATRLLEGWSPSHGGLTQAVQRAFDGARATEERHTDFQSALQRAGAGVASVPHGLAGPAMTEDLEAGWSDAHRLLRLHDAAVRAYLAARLFGNWIAYSANGLADVVEYLRVCLAVLEMEAARQQLAGGHLSERQRLLNAIRQSDFLLVHLSDVRRLAVRITVTAA